MEWDATAMALEFPEGKGRVVDGSDTDGRSKIFAEDVTAVMTELQSWVTALEADSNLRRNVIIKPSVNVEV